MGSTPSPSGHLVELHDSTIDFRDHLDGQPIHNGDQLEVWRNGDWHVVHYEGADFAERAVDVYGDQWVGRLDRTSMRVRWPMRR